MKVLCKTFADRAAQLRFVNTFLSTNACAVCSPERLESREAHVLTATSLEAAIKLKNSLSQERATNQHSLENGIFLGRPSFKVLSDQELADIRYWLRSIGGCQSPNACRTYSRFLGTGDYDLSVVYHGGENVIATHAVHPDQEWLATITHLMVYGQSTISSSLFSKGPSLLLYNKEVVFSQTQTGLTNQSWFAEISNVCVYPLKAINRKAIVYPSGVGGSYLTMDIVICAAESAKILYLPKPRDVVKVANPSERQLPFLLLLKTIRHPSVQGQRLKKVRGTPVRWQVVPNLITISINSTSVTSEPIPHHINAGYFYVD